MESHLLISTQSNHDMPWLPPCALCSVADAAHAAANSPLACLQLLAHAPAILARHGPFADAAALFAAVRDGAQSVDAVLEADARPVVVLGPDGVPRLAADVVEEGVLPAAARLVDCALRLVAARAPPPARTKDARDGDARDDTDGCTCPLAPLPCWTRSLSHTRLCASHRPCAAAAIGNNHPLCTMDAEKQEPQPEPLEACVPPA